MKTRVFVLIPQTVPFKQLMDHSRQLLEPYRLREDAEESHTWRFDYLVGFEGGITDPRIEQLLSAELRESLSGRLCEADRVPEHQVPGALVTPDGHWHDLSDTGWRLQGQSVRDQQAYFKQWNQQVRTLLSQHTECWVLEVWAHS